jgi:hypothetical protein
VRELTDQPPRHRRGEQRLPGRDHPDRVEEPLRGRVLEQEPARARPQRVEDILVQVEGRQDEHLRHPSAAGAGVSAASTVSVPDELPGGLDPVGPGHPHVHEHHIRPQFAAHPHRLGAVRGHGEHGEVRLGAEQRREPGPHDLMIIRDDDPDGRPAHRPDPAASPLVPADSPVPAGSRVTADSRVTTGARGTGTGS